jgi:hypothetical protein
LKKEKPEIPRKTATDKNFIVCSDPVFVGEKQHLTTLVQTFLKPGPKEFQKSHIPFSEK